MGTPRVSIHEPSRQFLCSPHLFLGRDPTPLGATTAFASVLSPSPSLSSWADETGGEEEIEVRFGGIGEDFALVSFGREWSGRTGGQAFVEGAVWRFDPDENWRNAGRSGLVLFESGVKERLCGSERFRDVEALNRRKTLLRYVAAAFRCQC
ncbi:hypothetical protein MUK42_35879 [Musa troglodytarum]|uniref:Uncharacterized protein n=1 Tax=Musa troglodytarum TaxID=320322 RepID=A0A9E7JVF0_9LILI|nr:hypothetical protein MUK42_35879 [Musa troglodytarum]